MAGGGWFTLGVAVALAACSSSNERAAASNSTTAGAGAAAGAPGGGSAGRGDAGAAGGASPGAGMQALGGASAGGAATAGRSAGGARADGGAGNAAGDGVGAGAPNEGTGAAGGNGAGGRAGGGGAPSGAGQAGMSNVAGNDFVPATCSNSGSCDPASCSTGSCFDPEHCATADRLTWGLDAQDEYPEALVLGPGDVRVLAGAVSLRGGSSDWDAFVVELAPDGQELWSQQVHLDHLRNQFSSALVDANGNVYAAGLSEAAFEGQENAGGYDLLLVKFDPSGHELWSLLTGTPGTDFAEKLAFDGDGDVLVAAQWDVDSANHASEAAVVKVTPDGALLDTVVLSLDSPAEADTVDVDASGNWFVTGRLDDKFPASDVFVSKLGTDGSALWTVVLTGTDSAFPNAVVIDDNGDCLVSGTTNGGLEGHAVPVVGNWSLFVSRISGAGEKLWTRQYGGGSALDMRGGALALAANGDLLVSGTVVGELTLESDALGADSYFMRLCADGSVKSLLQTGVPGDDWCYGVAEAADGRVLLSGYAPVEIDSSSAVQTKDAFLVTLAPE